MDAKTYINTEYDPLPNAALVHAVQSDLLHIAHRYHAQGPTGPIILADCGTRIVQYTYHPFVFNHWGDAAFDLSYVFDAFTLCPRCGDRAAFMAAFEEMKAGHDERLAAQMAEQEARHERRKQAFAEQSLDLKAINRVLVSAGFDAKFIGDKMQSTPAVEIDYGEFVYTITPMFGRVK